MCVCVCVCVGGVVYGIYGMEKEQNVSAQMMERKGKHKGESDGRVRGKLMEMRD